jgi:hypothetical protein
MAHRRLHISAVIALAQACTNASPAASNVPGMTAALSAGAPSQPTTSIGAIRVVSVASAHAAHTTDGRRHLVYELVFTNTGDQHARLERIDIRPRALGARRISKQGDALAAMVLYVNADQSTLDMTPGGQAVAFFDLAWPSWGPLPRSLAHDISVAAGENTLRGAAPTIDVADDEAPPLSPPLRGEGFGALNGCCNSAHTRALFAFDDGFFLAQRFAIDFLQVRDLSTSTGDPTQNASYFIYGADILAAADGDIVEVVDGIAENVPTEPLPPPQPDTLTGNHIVQALPDGRFALYAHIKPGTMQVKTGDHVTRGQHLANVGNSGNSTEPHLHFHVMDRASPLDADGLPYTFEAFDLQGRLDIAATPPTIDPVRPVHRRHQLPRAWDVMSFP